MKRKLVIVLGVSLALLALVGFTVVDALTGPITYEDCINELKPYLVERGLDAKVFGTDEAMQFANDMIFDATDSFKNHSYYNEICGFLIKYRELYFDYTLCRDNFKISVEAGEELYNKYKGNNPCLVYNAETNELQFVLTEEFLNTVAK